MSNRKKSPKPSPFKIVNLEEGMPTVHEALARLSSELALARHRGHFLLKLIHGYGSSGTGGEIRIAIQSQLRGMVQNGQVKACIYGENWSQADEETWRLLSSRTELKQDADLGRRNPGITIVVL